MRTNRGIKILDHAVRQAFAKGFPLNAVVEAIDNPQLRYANTRYPNQWYHCRDGIAVIVDEDRWVAITVWADRQYTPRRPDQTDARADKHFRGRSC